MIWRRDHVAGGAMVVLALAVLSMSGDLPFGTLASPGAGMLPILTTGLILLFGVALVLQAAQSPPLAEITWPDLPHATRIVAITGASIFAYERLGFLITTAALLLVLILIVERRPAGAALAISIGVPVAAYLLLAKLLRSALPIGIFGL